MKHEQAVSFEGTGFSGLPWWTVKNLPAMQETRLDPWVGKIPRRRRW